MPDLLDFYKISYDDARHEYTRMGIRLDSVSSVLPYLSNEWLNANPQVMKRAEGRGRGVAAMIEASLGGALTRLVSELSVQWNSWEEFRQETGFKVLSNEYCTASELFVYHDLLDYVGRLDLVGVCENLSKDVVVIDVKATALVPKTVGPQTAGYFEAYNRCAKFYGLPKAKKRAVLWLNAKSYRYLPLDNPLDWPRFTSRLTDTRWARELGYQVEWKQVDKNGVSPTGDVFKPEDCFT